MDLNKLARQITLAEGKKVSLSIAQVKEVLYITLCKLADMPSYELEKTLKRYRLKK